MPAQSQQQQKLFGLALSVKRGDTPRSEASKEILKIVDTMTEKEIEDFAGTDHEGLPKKVEQKIREMARQTIKEQLMGEAKYRIGDMVRVVDNPKYVANKKEFAGKSGYVKDTMGRDVMVYFPNGRSILVDPKDLEMNPNESVNESNGEFVVYIEKDNGRKKLLHTKKSQRAANMWMTKNRDKILNTSGIRLIGSMSKDQWEKKEAMYAENIKKSDMKTVTKKEWDRTHKDYKGMIKGQPYMMWFDKKTQATVYGPVNIKESVNEANSSMSKEIASMTGTRQPAVQQFIDKHNINALKLAMYLNKQGLRGRMDFATALSGKPNNPIQKKMIKMFKESVVNERKMRDDIQKLIKQKGYTPIFNVIKNSKRDLKQLGYSRGEIQDTLYDMFGDEDPKIVLKIEESVVNEAVNADKFEKAVLNADKLTNNIYLGTTEILDSLLAGMILDKGLSGAKKSVKELTDLYKSLYESVNK